MPCKRLVYTFEVPHYVWGLKRSYLIELIPIFLVEQILMNILD